MRYLADVATLQLFSEKCTGCRVCTDVCPHAVFIMENKRAVINQPDSCMECGACVLNCEHGALAVEKGVGCAAALVHSLLTGEEPSCDCSPAPGASSCC